MEKEKLQLKCLVLAQSFETLWAYHSLSSGQLYHDECHSEAIRFYEVYKELAELDPKILDPNELKIGEKTNVNDILERFKSWAKGDNNKYSYDRLVGSGWVLRLLISCLKDLLLKELGLSERPLMVLSSAEEDHSTRIIRWQPHLPRRALLHGPDKIVRLASNSPTIAVVGDIRRSQDLMTYAQEPKDFSMRMVQFIETTRELVEKHFGFFDKFTGDGFIVYFNDAVCKIAEINYIECFLNFIKDELAFAGPFFNEWERSIRKRPINRIGLALGADIGKITFDDVKNHLIAVGDAIVWATRIASSASSQEVLVNNLLFATLDNRKDISFQERESKTKTGKAFLSQVMKFTDYS